MQKEYRLELTLTTEANASVHTLRRVKKALREYAGKNNSRQHMEVTSASCETIEPPAPTVGVGARFTEGVDGSEYILALTGRAEAVAGTLGKPKFALIGITHGESWDHESMPLEKRLGKMWSETLSAWVLTAVGNQNSYSGTAVWEGQVAL